MHQSYKILALNKNSMKETLLDYVMSKLHTVPRRGALALPRIDP